MDRLDFSNMSLEGLIEREWLATNGIGGYASSTICGLNTRKYHGLLVAAMSPPVRRMVLLSHVDETILADGVVYPIACNEYPGTISPRGDRALRAFSPEPFPRWAYQSDGFTIEKSLRLLRGENTVCLTYTLLGGDKSVELQVRPQLALRGIHELMYQWNGRLDGENKSKNQVRIPPTSRTPEVFFAHDGLFDPTAFWYLNTIYRREQERGYAGLEDLWMPGAFAWKLSPGQTVHLFCSTEPVEIDRGIARLNRQSLALAATSSTDGLDSTYDSLVRATEAFITTGAENATGERGQYVIGQYPWSPASGRSACVAFAGLFLVPGRFDEGRRLLLFLASQMQDGLIPSEFPENGEAPIYHGADTALWFINAVHEYWRYTRDDATARALLPKVETIIEKYRHGTALGISTDGGGLLASREAGLATTWMNAKLADWVITPRQGRAVELNALWYNALRITADLAGHFGQQMRGEDLTQLADRVQVSFNERFWNADMNCLFDVVDDHGNDPAIRPNQIFAISLAHPVLASGRQQAVVQTVVDELLTPVGVRTLARRDPSYEGKYFGNVQARDRARHQGSAFPWLLGPLVTAYLRVNGRSDRTIAQVRHWLGESLAHLQGNGIGQLCELF